MTCTNHDFTIHPNHDHLRCEGCGATLREAIDYHIDRAERLRAGKEPSDDPKAEALDEVIRAVKLMRRVG